MCGLYGALRLDPEAGPIDPAVLDAMDRCLASRGPDGAGLWRAPAGDDGTSPVVLGHRRLAILDPTPRGDQPMVSADGRRAIVYNGEIYNFRTLRRELEADGVVFRTTTDTEVLLALYHRHGPAFLNRLRGMYALALWDGDRRGVLLARDPLGIKPLYHATGGGHLLFASQARALEAVSAVADDPDPAGVAGFLLWGSVPEPHTLRRDIRALPAGHHLWVSADRPRTADPVRHGAPEGRYGAVSEALEDSVQAHLVSDVPVAVFLSAGLDSTLVAALATRHLSQPPVTFTLAVAGSGEADEAAAAARVAEALGTRHVERRIAPGDLDDLWPAVTAAMDLPSIDGFNTFVVARLAHEEGIKVALSGLGGDELLGGYPSFDDVPRIHRWARRLARIPGARSLWPPLAGRLFPTRPKLTGLPALGRTFAGAYFLRRGLFLPAELPALVGPDRAAEGLAGLARHMPATCRESVGTVPAVTEPPTGIVVDPLDPWRSVHRLETARYLRNQLLRDADWAGMASSVEIRVPLVDETLRRALVEDPQSPLLAAGPPGRDAKRTLVRETAPELPAEIFERPKQGFYVPVGGGPGDAAGRRRGLDSRALALRLLRERGAV